MLEFRIVIQNGNARPYSLSTYPTFEACYSQLVQLIHDKSTQVRHEYYVLNDFYNNTYPPFLGDITKYKIEWREVAEWNIYKKENEQENNKKYNKSNVIPLFG